MVAAPLGLYFVSQKFESREAVTAGWVLYALGVAGGAAALGAALSWYTLTRPLIARYSEDGKKRPSN